MKKSRKQIFGRQDVAFSNNNNNKKKIGEQFHPPFPTTTNVVPGRVPYGICSRFDYLSPPRTGDQARILTPIILNMMYLAIAVLLTINHFFSFYEKSCGMLCYLLISLPRTLQRQFNFSVNASMITSHEATVTHIGK